MLRLVTTTLTAGLLLIGPVSAGTLFDSGSPDGKIGMATRIGPGSGANQETETADDFILTWPLTILDSATFIGLLPASVNLQTGISQVTVEIYRVFPKDSDTGRTSGPPTFSTAQVPTRVNSPSDVEFVDRSVSGGTLSFTVTQMNPVFTVSNSVDTGIHLGTGGDGPVTGQEVLFTVTFTKPLLLPADHYFFVPQVLASDPNVHFLWLSAPRPIVFGTPFNPDLQAWIRNADLEPDWLRVGTDIVGGGVTFNASFSLDGRLPTVYEYDFYKAGTTTVAAALLSPGFLRDVSPASVPIEGFTGFIGPSPDSLNVCDLTSNSSAELDCRGPNLHSGIFEFIFDRGAFPTTLGPFVGSGFLAPDATTPSIGTANLLGGQIRVLNPI